MTKANNKWYNWVGTVSCTPHEILEPASVDEIAELLGKAEQNDRTIRVVATGHATNAMPCCDDIMLSTRNLTGLIDLDEDNKEATFGPHTHLEDAAHMLAKRGYAIPMLPWLGTLSLGGTAAVAAHGSSINRSSLSEYIVAMEIVRPDGTIDRLRRGEAPDNIFNAHAVHLGVLGVVTALTFTIEPLFAVRTRILKKSWDAWLDGALDEMRASEFVEAHYLPHTDGVIVFSSDLVPLDELPTEQLSVPRRLWPSFQWDLGSLMPALIPKLAQREYQRTHEEAFVQHGYEMMLVSESPRHFGMEHALEPEAGLAALREMRSAIDGSGMHINFLVGIRYTAADAAWMSPCHGRDSMCIANYLYFHHQEPGYLDMIEKIMLTHGSRPHWGKCHNLTANDLSHLYPRWNEFIALRNQYDPAGRLQTPYMTQLLGT